MAKRTKTEKEYLLSNISILKVFTTPDISCGIEDKSGKALRKLYAERTPSVKVPFPHHRKMVWTTIPRATLQSRAINKRFSARLSLVDQNFLYLSLGYQDI